MLPAAYHGGRTMLPRVILHTAVSVDGRIDHISPDLGLFYGLIRQWHEDATLVGSETFLQATQAEVVDETSQAGTPEPASDDGRPLLVVPDSRGRVRAWPAVPRMGHWRAGVAMVSQTTPTEYLDYLRRCAVDAIVAGRERVDFRVALEELSARHGVRTVRVDSGGTLNGVLLRAGLVHEVNVLVHPALVGGTSSRSLFRAPDLESPDGVIPLDLTSVERHDGGVVWLRYTVAR
jgi:2,5-diamino-6-(ribosylamino)-4(3H)-pyrimidinone 5'-phosphate reductase